MASCPTEAEGNRDVLLQPICVQTPANEASAEQCPLQAAVSRLKLSSPISRLPDELLVAIFHFYHSQWAEYCLFAQDDAVPHYRWIKITHVCRRWRNVALGAPLLWTDLRVTTPECVENMLSRTASTDIQVEGPLTCSPLGIYPSACPLAWKVAFGASARLNLLSFTVSVTDDDAEEEHITYTSWPSFSEDQFPKLKMLELFAKEDVEDAIDRLPPIFSENTVLPSLAVLSADRFTLRALKPLFSISLRALNLYEFGGRSITWESLLECLSCLTSLHELSMDDRFPSLPPDFDDLPLILDAPVALPSLQLLKTACNDAGAASGLLLRNLQLPARTYLKIEYGVEVDQDEFESEILEDDLDTFMSALSMRLSGEITVGSPSPIVTLGLFDEVDKENPTLLEIRGYTATWSLRRLPKVFSRIDGARAFSFLLRVTGFTPDVRLSSLRSLRPLDSVKMLAIDCECDEEGLREGLAHMANVTGIWVSGRCAAQVFNTLMLKPEYPDPLFPNLETLHISSMCLAVSMEDDEDETQPTNDMWLLMLALRELEEEGLPLKRIILSKCYNVAEFLLDVLAALGLEVIWDGRVLIKDSV